MDHLKWKTPARIVAIVDLVLQCIGVLIVLAIFLRLQNHEEADSDMEQGTKEADQNVPKNDLTTFLWTLLLLFGIIIVIIIFVCAFWADIMLLKATKQGATHDDAVKQVWTWLKVNAVLTCISCLHIFWTTYYASMLAGLTCRGILIFIVYRLEHITKFSIMCLEISVLYNDVKDNPTSRQNY